jgi:hypothetical protein
MNPYGKSWSTVPLNVCASSCTFEYAAGQREEKGLRRGLSGCLTGATHTHTHTHTHRKRERERERESSGVITIPTLRADVESLIFALYKCSLALMIMIRSRRDLSSCQMSCMCAIQMWISVNNLDDDAEKSAQLSDVVRALLNNDSAWVLNCGCVACWYFFLSCLHCVKCKDIYHQDSYVYVCVYVCMGECECMYGWVRVCMHVYVCMYVCKYIHVCIYVCIYNMIWKFSRQDSYVYLWSKSIHTTTHLYQDHARARDFAITLMRFLHKNCTRSSEEISFLWLFHVLTWLNCVETEAVSRI